MPPTWKVMNLGATGHPVFMSPRWQVKNMSAALPLVNDTWQQGMCHLVQMKTGGFIWFWVHALGHVGLHSREVVNP